MTGVFTYLQNSFVPFVVQERGFLKKYNLADFHNTNHEQVTPLRSLLEKLTKLETNGERLVVTREFINDIKLVMQDCVVFMDEIAYPTFFNHDNDDPNVYFINDPKVISDLLLINKIWFICNRRQSVPIIRPKLLSIPDTVNDELIEALLLDNIAKAELHLNASDGNLQICMDVVNDFNYMFNVTNIDSALLVLARNFNGSFSGALIDNHETINKVHKFNHLAINLEAFTQQTLLTLLEKEQDIDISAIISSPIWTNMNLTQENVKPVMKEIEMNEINMINPDVQERVLLEERRYAEVINAIKEAGKNFKDLDRRVRKLIKIQEQQKAIINSVGELMYPTSMVDDMLTLYARIKEENIEFIKEANEIIWNHLNSFSLIMYGDIDDSIKCRLNVMGDIFFLNKSQVAEVRKHLNYLSTNDAKWLDYRIVQKLNDLV